MLFNTGTWLDIYSKEGKFENLGLARIIGDYAGFALVRGTVDNHGKFIIEAANALCSFQNQNHLFPDAVIVNQGTFEVRPQATCVAGYNDRYPVYRQTGGETVINGQFAAKNLDVQQGTLRGSGTLTLTGTASQIGMGAVISPGSADGAFGTLAVINTLALSGDLDVEIGGATAGLFDVLHVDGTVTLGGTLNVILRGGFVPQAGDTFDVVHATAINGQFVRANLPALPADRTWSISYGTSAVRLLVQ